MTATPLAPAAAATRTTAPALPGERGRSSSTSGAVRPASTERSGAGTRPVGLDPGVVGDLRDDGPLGQGAGDVRRQPLGERQRAVQVADADLDHVVGREAQRVLDAVEALERDLDAHQSRPARASSASICRRVTGVHGGRSGSGTSSRRQHSSSVSS